jgi:hypothetical protein
LLLVESLRDGIYEEGIGRKKHRVHFQELKLHFVVDNLHSVVIVHGFLVHDVDEDKQREGEEHDEGAFKGKKYDKRECLE